MQQNLQFFYNKIDSRNNKLGLERYDPSDLNSLPLYRLAYSCGRIGYYCAKLLKAPELAAPKTWRTLVGCKKTTVPTTYYHIGMSYLDQLHSNIDSQGETTAKVFDILKHAREQAIPECKDLVWGHSYPYLGVGRLLQSPSIPCGHHSARLSYLLARASRTSPLSAEKLKPWARSAALGVLRSFNWWEVDKGWVASYFPTTHDEVINIMAEYAMVLSEALRQGLLAEEELDAKKKLHGLVQVIVTEQSESGLWGYYTKDYADRANLISFVDNHHSAMVLTALVRILSTGQLDAKTSAIANNALNKGISFFLDHLLMTGGIALYFPDKRREADISGYSESIIMLSESATSPYVLPHLKSRSAKVASMVLERVIQLFLLPSGDVASYRHFGLRVNLQSIRWGSGLLMEAISRYLLLLADQGNN